MTTPLRLAVFDLDGTLVDSQAEIVAAMRAAFAAESLDPPPRVEILATVGLSLELAMARLVPALAPARRRALVASYRAAYFGARQERGASPLFPGARAALERMAADPFLLMGVATGKSRRGLDALIEAHDLEGFFTTRQSADQHPSKPHPAMLEAALDAAGVAPRAAVMIGDTAFDIDMARAAGTGAIGVTWGYHPAQALAADRLIADFSQLPEAVGRVLEMRA